MGVDLGDWCARSPVQLDDFQGKIVAVDAYNTLYQFLSIIRQRDGTPLKDDQGRITSHLSGLFHRLLAFAQAGVMPVFVFDGTPSPLKRATLDARRTVKERAQRAYEEALAEGDLETARSKAQQTSTLTAVMVGQAKRLLAGLGVPVVDAPGEGEAQASRMAQRGTVHAVSSQDYDVVLFGAPRLVRNLGSSGRRKLPGRAVWVDAAPEMILLSQTLERMRLNREQLVDAAILIGTDYNPGVAGIGPKTAVELIREHRNLEAVLERSETETSAPWPKIRKGQEGLGDFEAVRELFLNPATIDITVPALGPLDPRAVRSLLVDEHRFDPGRVDASLKKYQEGQWYRRQATLGDWG